MALLYHTGLRREEAAGGVMGDFVRRNGAWQLRVIGKRSKERHVTVNSALLDELVRYRSVLFFSPPCPALPQPGERIPLVGSVQISNQQLMTPRRLHGLVHNIMRAAAATCDDPHIADRLNAASTHWMRHTNATHRLAAGASLDTTQDELGHSDPKTTRIYSATALAQRQADAELLVGRLNTSGNL